MTPEELLEQLVQSGGSDLIVRTNGRPSVRVDGKVWFISDSPVPPALSQELFERILDGAQQDHFFRTGEADTAFQIQEIGRFRVNVFRERGRLAFVFRHVKSHLPSMDELKLPVEQLVKLCHLRRGLVLVTGVTGSGKSSTLAAMLEWINKNEQRHIVTLEDPIEYMFGDDRSTVNQREIGVDTLSFASALKAVMRQAPDVIMVGEMRDEETTAAVLQAAETGHLVFSTLHTVNAIQTIERVLSFFQPHHHALIRTQLSMNLEGVISQRLIPRRGSLGRVPAIELLLATPRVKELLSEGRTKEISHAISEGAEHYGTMTFNQSLVRLIREGDIAMEDALRASDNPDEVKLEMRGISKGGRGNVFDQTGAPKAAGGESKFGGGGSKFGGGGGGGSKFS